MRSLSVIALVLATHSVGHFYMAWRLLPSLVTSAAGWVIGISLLAISWIFIPLTVVADEFIDSYVLQEIVIWIGALSMSIVASLFVLTLLREVVVLIGRFASVSPDALKALTAWGVIVVTLGVTIAGYFIARRPATIELVSIPIARSYIGLSDLKIVQISDIHVGPTIKRPFVERMVQQVNALKPDVVVITGDLVDGDVERLERDVAALKQLQAPMGVFFITGNHEYYSGARPWVEEVKRLGITVLENQHYVLTKNGAQLTLAGVRDYSAQQFEGTRGSSPYEAIAGAPKESLKLLLAHQPRSAASAAAAGFDVQLSGHTHGGQFWPWNFFVKVQQPFVSGLNQWNEGAKPLWVYVSRGTGYWGPPNRFGVPPEITQIQFVAESEKSSD